MTTEDEARVAEADAVLARCEIDETSEEPPLRAIEARLRLAVHDLRAGEESSCSDWQGDPVPLRAGPAEDYPVVARALPGQSILYSYRGEPGWEFVAVWDETDGMERGPVAFGWHPADAVDLRECGMLAG